MRPHPLFKARSIPAVHALGEFTLRSLSIGDLDRDFAAVMESAAEIKAANPGSSWPEGLTREKNLIDLAWHQREFEARRSFAWVIENTQGEYLGCLYIYPSIAGEQTADVIWWWRSGVEISRQSFREKVTAWLASDAWPRLDYVYRTD
ncbi:GNAT family N-acetyltransferase [Devosia riboflavina]|uniref:GNAT family N-acetyltransferase n=1 Tax=Devosia riboflavina TaxID=46914 RepID=UPI00126A7371|nr:GNAT family N-acetyltransferase [Devosia riboflavina]